MRWIKPLLFAALLGSPAYSQISSRATSLRGWNLCNPIGAKTAGFVLTWDGTNNCWKSSGTFTAASGAAATPSYSFASFTGQGMYAASGVLGFSLNGASAGGYTSAGFTAFGFGVQGDQNALAHGMNIRGDQGVYGMSNTFSAPTAGLSSCAGVSACVAVGNGTAADVSGKIKAASAQVSVVTVSGLPTCNGAAEGTIYAVSDATAPTYNATLTGSGAVHTLAACNGTNWVAH